MRLFLLLLFLFSCGLSASGQTPLPMKSLEGLTQSDILRKADYFLVQSVPSIVDKKYSFSGNVHNYESLSTYYWPDTLQSSSSPWVYRDGQKNPERLNYDGGRINHFTQRVTVLARAYQMTLRDCYRQQWLSDMRHFFINSATRMNPNFDYAQIVVNTHNNQGNYYGIIDGYVLIDVVESIYLMRQLDGVDKKTDKALQKWFGQLAKWLQKSEMGKQMDAASNNISIAYDVMLYAFSVYAGTTSKLRAITQNMSMKIPRQILPDGRQPAELKRAKPMSYSLYNLEHIIDFCLMQRRNGMDYVNLQRSHIEAALSFLHGQLDIGDNLNNAEKKEHHSLTLQLQRLEAIYRSDMIQEL